MRYIGITFFPVDSYPKMHSINLNTLLSSDLLLTFRSANTAHELHVRKFSIMKIHIYFLQCAHVARKLRFHLPKITSNYAEEEVNTHTASYRMMKHKYLNAALRD
jgi:hypothetical protein